MVFLNSKSTERMITTQNLSAPSFNCPVCSPYYAKLRIPTGASHTLQELVDELKRRFEYEDFSITTDAGVIYDPDLEDNLEKPLEDLDIKINSNGFITVRDDSDQPRVDLVLSTSAHDEEQGLVEIYPHEIELPPKPVQVKEQEDAAEQTNGVSAGVPVGEKRKREAEDEVESAKKRAKAGGDGEAVIVEDDGAILLDD